MGAAETESSTDVSRASRAPPQDRGHLQVPAGSIIGAPGNAAARAFTGTGVQSVRWLRRHQGRHLARRPAYAQLQQSYKPFAARPFDLPSELDPYWLTLVGNRIALYPWEYTYEAKTERETKPIGMTSPVRWVMSFTSATRCHR